MDIPKCLVSLTRPSLKETALIKVAMAMYRNAVNLEVTSKARSARARELIRNLYSLPRELRRDLMKILPSVVKELYEGSNNYMVGFLLFNFGNDREWSTALLLRVEPQVPYTIFESILTNNCKYILACRWCLREKIEYYSSRLNSAHLPDVTTYPDQLVRFWQAFDNDDRETAMLLIGKPVEKSVNSYGFSIATKKFDFIPMKYFWCQLNLEEKEIHLNDLCNQMELHNSFNEDICYFILFLTRSPPGTIADVCRKYPQIPLVVFVNFRFRREFQAVVKYFLPIACEIDSVNCYRVLRRILRDSRIFCDDVTIDNLKYFLYFKNSNGFSYVGEYLLTNPLKLLEMIKLVCGVYNEWCVMIFVNYLYNYDRQKGLRFSAALYSETYVTEEDISYNYEGIIVQIVGAFIRERKYHAMKRFLQMFTITAEFAETLYQRLDSKFASTQANAWGRQVVIKMLNHLIIWDLAI